MSPDEIIERFAAFVDQHEQGNRGLPSQEPYKGDFFTLFVESYNQRYMDIDNDPRLTADGLRQALPKHIALESPLLQELFGYWEEWTYAWDRANQRTV